MYPTISYSFYLMHSSTSVVGRVKGKENTSKVLDHNLQQYFPELLKFESTPEMAASELYKKIRAEVESILNSVIVSEQPAYQTLTNLDDPDVIRALAWNIERGTRFDGIVNALINHDGLRDRDVLLLTELDYGMARSGNRFVARELAEELGLNYAFAPVYIALQKGSGVEEFAE